MVLLRWCLGVNDSQTSYPWNVLSTPRFRTVPLPLVDPRCDDGGYFGGGGGDNDRGDDNFPGGGINDHQSAEQWTGVSVQQAETPRSLATAKPNHIEYHNQSEVSAFFTPLEIVLYINGLDNSRAVRLPQPRGAATTALGIPRRRPGASPKSAKRWEFLQQRVNFRPSGKVYQLFETCNWFLTLTWSPVTPVIQFLGGTVPEPEEPLVWLIKSQRQAWKLGARRECFEELRDLVGPWSTKLYELKVLNNGMRSSSS